MWGPCDDHRDSSLKNPQIGCDQKGLTRRRQKKHQEHVACMPWRPHFRAGRNEERVWGHATRRLTKCNHHGGKYSGTAHGCLQMQRSTTPLPQHPRASTTFAPPISKLGSELYATVKILVHVLSKKRSIPNSIPNVIRPGTCKQFGIAGRCAQDLAMRAIRMPFHALRRWHHAIVLIMASCFWLDCAAGTFALCWVVVWMWIMSMCAHNPSCQEQHTLQHTLQRTLQDTLQHTFILPPYTIFFGRRVVKWAFLPVIGLHVEIGLHPNDSRMPPESVFIEEKRISRKRGRGIGSHPTSVHVPITHTKWCGYKRRTWWARCARWQGALAPVATGLSACGVCDLVSEPRLRANGCSTAHHRASVWTPRTRHCDRALGWGSCFGLGIGCSLHAPQRKRFASRPSTNPSTSFACWNSDYLDCFWKTISWQRLQL